ncbi:alkaline phosphatase family protein [Fluoribacter gormanii]|uniref:Alkaline phosphatase n=1 Tax=Fluoribacter gormanii TaxID=464 RepID=A0A377GHZ1_9GAMM|nr:alkaline phosphatase family protein [Fluoribacter gormanii]KTD03341.1 alkaline phosphatase [Fluoribacter gormanii]MCW8444070.1 alkaline phosphatase family protein [Fluoribacter gormanii]MCW8469252.1 alkaline phosphatase family protein [Fluoribacter gormanii]SIQ52857.1 Type I phosphodiesterase / nucleotide pyrophosphatase [Fluoribacter gormanii]STO24368.1 Alkaline phosphatase precursor [Fluoribacter gormanii]
MKKYLCSIFLFLNCLNTYAQIHQPKLVVQLVIDQLRGDLIFQHQQQFGNGGFNYLLSHAIDYHNTHHPHANTTTCAGHATVATGSFPALHGIVNNEWYDRKSRQMVYCMEDLKTNILQTSHTRIAIPGRSPKNLYVSTLSDEVVLSQKGRVFGVSLKDRSAIALAGHAGKAFWFDTTNGGFITSTYYYKQYPQWVKNWNKNYHPQDYDWHLSRSKSEYQNANSPVFHHEDELFGQTFPHHITQAPSPEYFKSLSRTPKADQLTADFAEQLLTKERLGQSSGKTDYLGISFSGVDAIGHQFGPNSLESEDNLLELDKTLAHLFAVIDKQVGLNNTLIVLTADHGVNDGPTYLKAHHMDEINPINIPQMEQYIRASLKSRYALPEQTLMSITPPYIYLNHKVINKHKIELNEVKRYIAHALTLQPGIFKAYALPITDIEKDWLSAKVNKMYFPNRSGDIYLIQPPNQSYGTKGKDRVAHGSPWQYDSFVPLLFVHPDFKAQRIFRTTYTTDIAPTLSAVLMIKNPSAATGHPLQEVLSAFN